MYKVYPAEEVYNMTASFSALATPYEQVTVKKVKPSHSQLQNH